jgi:hypothetical protein
MGQPVKLWELLYDNRNLNEETDNVGRRIRKGTNLMCHNLILCLYICLCSLLVVHLIEIKKNWRGDDHDKIVSWATGLGMMMAAHWGAPFIPHTPTHTWARFFFDFYRAYGIHSGMNTFANTVY